MVEAIKVEAEKRYESGYGWQVIVECLNDEEILAQIVGQAKSVNGALRSAKRFANLLTEREEEVSRW